MKKLTILGSTGSIGVSTLSLVERFPERFRVVSLAAGRNLQRLKEQVQRFQPEIVSLTNGTDARDLRLQLPEFRGEILYGDTGLRAAATHPEADMVVAALVGAAGLAPT